MIVVDASALIAVVTGRRPDGRWVREQIRDQWLLSTHVMPAEVHNALRRMELRGELSPSDAMVAREEFFEFNFELYRFAPYADRIWALRRNLTCYDAWYVALAEWLDCPLVTLDGRLNRASGPICEIIAPPGSYR